MKQIIPLNNNGSIQLKFQHEGQAYRFNPIKGGKFADKVTYDRACAIGHQISLDISIGKFDQTLEKYHLDTRQTLSRRSPVLAQQGKIDLLSLWDSWVTSLDLAPRTQADHYAMVRCMIVKAGKVRLNDITWLQPFRESLAPSTFNKRLGYLKSCLSWAINEGLFNGLNPYLKVKPLKSSPQDERVKPFSKDEITLILDGFKEHYPDYAPFVRFLFATGVRTGEAIALQWKHISFEYGQIKICESLSVDRSGNGYQRIRKGTKTDTVRYLPLTGSLSALLRSIEPIHPDAEALVFPSPSGNHIDPGRFRQHIWKPLLAQMCVEYRNPYQTRHTLLTHAVMDPAIGVLGAAKLAGHKDSRMVTQHYARFIGQPSLPEMDI
jgi:integrase